MLEELIGEIGSLASVYHKPAETFIGKGRLGADAMQKRAVEEADESQSSTQKALQTVVAGQQSENLLSVLLILLLLGSFADHPVQIF